MALLAFAIYDTLENKRTEITKRCLQSLKETVDLKKHRLFLIDNASCQETKDFLVEFVRENTGTVITNEENIGTAEAINIALMHRVDGEKCVKIDNDCVWHQAGWVELLEECIDRDPSIGIAAAKRKDCWETTVNTDPDYKTVLLQIPHEPGRRWITVEKAKHIIGTCTMFNPALLNKVGYMKQFSLYGFDDTLMSWRSTVAGFKNVFVPQIEIDHIDPGDTPYQSWKEKHSAQFHQALIDEVNGYLNGSVPIFYSPFLNTQP